MKRGFALLTKEERIAMAERGGRASQESGRGHRFTSEEAARAGMKGGRASKRRRKQKQEGDEI